MTVEFTSQNEQATQTLGERFAAQLREGDVVAFRGDLGAGKTVFSRGIMRGLGYRGAVASPTFAIVNEYSGGRCRVAHFDMYRIDSEQELYSTGFYDYLDGRWIILMEWSENVPFALESDTITVSISGSAQQARTITIQGAREKL